MSENGVMNNAGIIYPNDPPEHEADRPLSPPHDTHGQLNGVVLRKADAIAVPCDTCPPPAGKALTWVGSRTFLHTLKLLGFVLQPLLH